MKARDEVALSALRQALSAIAVAETAGDEVAVLSDEQVIAALVVEVRKHHETADAFVTAGRPEKVERARAEAAVLEVYLPASLSDDELTAIVGGGDRCSRERRHRRHEGDGQGDRRGSCTCWRYGRRHEDRRHGESSAGLKTVLG